MRILLLTTHLRIGGVPVYVVSLAAALRRIGHNVSVASSGGELVSRLEESGPFHIWLDIDTKSELSPKVFRGICTLYRLIKENGTELIHTHTRVAQVIGEALQLLTGVPHVSTCHGFFRPRFARRAFGCWGKRVIAISEAVREHLVSDFNINKSRVVLVHNGIDLDIFNKPYPAEEKMVVKEGLGLRQGPLVGIIARLSPVKGHRFLIEAMRHVVERIKDAQLLIVGEGEEGWNLKDLTKSMGLSDSVTFMDSILDTARVLSIMDVFALPSLEEGLGLALLEALACGCPVVASDVGGIYSIVKDGQTGLLVPPKDPARLADAVLRLLEDRALAERLGREGQSFVRENFSLADMARKVEAMYREVVAGQGRAV